jgi:hypothetical protein
MDAVLLSLISDLGLGLVARGHGIEVLEGVEGGHWVTILVTLFYLYY